MGERTVRDVMISQGGGGITVIYDMAPGQPQSQRVLRLENVNGMLEVIYDHAAPTHADRHRRHAAARAERRRHVLGRIRPVKQLGVAPVRPRRAARPHLSVPSR